MAFLAGDLCFSDTSQGHMDDKVKEKQHEL
jgi:hypothetical protein